MHLLIRKEINSVWKIINPSRSLYLQQNFERLIYNKMFNFFTEKNQFFKTNQDLDCWLFLQSITCYYPWNLWVDSSWFGSKGDFLSNVFDKVWHEGLLLKLNQNEVSGNYFKLFMRFFSLSKSSFWTIHKKISESCRNIIPWM